jgi:hypothetical protein
VTTKEKAEPKQDKGDKAGTTGVVVGARGVIRNMIAACKVLDPYPHPPVRIGVNIAHLVSASRSGPGWSTDMVEIEPGEGQSEIEIPDVLIDKFEGREADVPGAGRVKVNLRALVRGNSGQGQGGGRV